MTTLRDILRDLLIDIRELDEHTGRELNSKQFKEAEENLIDEYIKQIKDRLIG